MYCTLSVSLHWNAGFMRTRVLVHFYSLLYSLCLYCSVQLPHHVRLFVTPLTATRQASPSITNSQSLLKLMSIESVMPSSHFILCCPLLLQPSVFPNIKVFSSESVLRIRWLPTPIFLPGEFHGQSKLTGYYSPWGHKELDTTE